MYLVSDETVIRAKISWLQQELLGPGFKNSRHPIVRLLRATDIIKSDSFGTLQQQIEATINRIDLVPPKDEHEFRELCLKTGMYAAELEIGNYRDFITSGTDVSSACALTGFVQLLRENCRKKVADYSWVPLSLRARHQLNIEDLAHGSEPNKVGKLVQDLCETALSWLTHEVMRNLVSGSTAQDGSRYRFNHWLMQLNLHLKLVRSLSALNFHEHNRVLSSAGPVSVFRNWRFARTLKWN